MINQDVLARIPDSRQEFPMVELNYFINKLLCDVSTWAQMQRDHASHLILVNFDKVDACIRANNNLIALACRLHLVDMTDRLETFTDV